MAEAAKETAPAPAKSKGSKLSDEVLAKAPNLTPEFVAEHGLTDEDLEAIASGLVSPPPSDGPDTSEAKLRRIGGSWTIAHPDDDPENDTFEGKSR